MKKFLIELTVIVALSTAIGLVYNHFQDSSLPLLKKYQPNPAQAGDEDLSVYYNEIDGESLRSLLEANVVVLLDARNRIDYHNGHIPQAVSAPLGEFQQKYPELKELLANSEEQGKSIVIYCIGVNCLDSSLLAKELQKNEHREIFVYKGGIEEWQELGYPVEGAEGTPQETTERKDFQ